MSGPPRVVQWGASALFGLVMVAVGISVLIGLSGELERHGTAGVILGLVLAFVLGRYSVDR
jgi:hypothetical protein